MWQDVNNHNSRHKATDLITKTDLEVTSTHHQMMIAGPEGEVLCIANKATNFNSFDKSREIPHYDTEVVFYPRTRSLCFQPHPEWATKHSQCQDYFFNLINKLL